MVRIKKSLLTLIIFQMHDNRISIYPAWMMIKTVFLDAVLFLISHLIPKGSLQGSLFWGFCPEIYEKTDIRALSRPESPRCHLEQFGYGQ